MEVWKDVKGYDGFYQVSNLGRIKSMSRIVPVRNNGKRFTVEKIVKTWLNSKGYSSVQLSKFDVKKRHLIHSLVWDAFGDENRNGKEIDHIDGDKTNCNISNLQLLTGRENVIKAKKKAGRLTGAYKTRNTWYSRIDINGKSKYLGAFPTEKEAHQAYMKEKELLTIKSY